MTPIIYILYLLINNIYLLLFIDDINILTSLIFIIIVYDLFYYSLLYLSSYQLNGIRNNESKDIMTNKIEVL